MRIRLSLLLSLSAALALSAAQADEQLRAAQDSLKTLGFYSGAATGEMDVDTKGAIRRYQVRNGLEVTSTLTAETLSSLAKSNESPAPEAVPQQPSSAAPAGEVPEPQAAAPGPTPVAVAPAAAANRGPSAPPVPRGDREFLRSDRGTAPPVARPFVPGHSTASDPAYAEVFARTPFGNAPAEVQRDTLRRVQQSLAERGLFDAPVTGLPGPALEEALLRFQSSRRLPMTGRLDLDTLAELRLLPTARGSVKPLRNTEGALRGIPLD